MASLNLSQDEFKTLESVRSRLVQLTSSISSLKNDTISAQPLQSVWSLQASANILQQNLASLLDTTTTHADLLQRVALHPSTNFPGRTQEGIATHLLRKKLEPEIEKAEETARTAANERGIGPESFLGWSTAAANKPHKRDYDSDEEEEGYEEEDSQEEDEDAGPREPLGGLGETWAEARGWCIDRVARFIEDEAPERYTAEERAMGLDKVRTGLRRELDDESDSDEDEDEDMVEAGGAPGGGAPVGQPRIQGLDPEVILWAAARGDVDAPAYLELDSRKPMKDAALMARR